MVVPGNKGVGGEWVDATFDEGYHNNFGVGGIKA